MFGRLKQAVKEKAGKATVTALPDDVPPIVEFFSKWSDRDKSLIKAFNECTELWRKQKKLEVALELEELATLDNQVGKAAGRLKEVLLQRATAENEACEKIKLDFESKIKGFLSTELSTSMSAVSALKKRRLDKDATASDYASKATDERREKAEAAEKELDAAIERVREVGRQQADYDRRHVDFFTGAIAAFQTGFQPPTRTVPSQARKDRSTFG